MKLDVAGLCWDVWRPDKDKTRPLEGGEEGPSVGLCIVNHDKRRYRMQNWVLHQSAQLGKL